MWDNWKFKLTEFKLAEDNVKYRGNWILFKLAGVWGNQGWVKEVLLSVVRKKQKDRKFTFNLNGSPLQKAAPKEPEDSESEESDVG